MNDTTRKIAVLRNHYNPNATDKPTVAEVVKATRSLTEVVCSNEVREHPDFHKILRFVLNSFITLTNDDTLQIWSVADECLLTAIKPLVKAFPARVLSELLKGIKGGKGRSQRSALEKFAALCEYINPQKCRNFVTLLLEALEDILKNGDSLLQQTLGDNLDPICRTLIYYIRESEAQSLIQGLVQNLSNEEASVRRAAAKGITALCRYYPKSLFSFTVALVVLHRFKEIKNLIEKEEETEQSEGKIISAGLQGILLAITQLLKLSYELRGDKHDPRDPMECHLTDIIVVVEFCFTYSDHNVVSGSIELIDTVLSLYGGWHGSRKEQHIISFLLSHLCVYLLPSSMCPDSSPNVEKQQRVSIIAMSLQILGRLSYCYTDKFLYFFHQNYTPEKRIEVITTLFQGFSSDDPLLKGKTIFFAACLLRVQLEQQHKNDREFIREYIREKPEEIHPTTKPTSFLHCESLQITTIIRKILLGIQDASSVTSQEACDALEILLPLLNQTKHSDILIEIVSRLTNFTHIYWLIRSRIVALLAQLNFALLYHLERKEIAAKCKQKKFTRYARDSLQTHVLYFITKHLEDEDSRVVDAAACALRDIIPHLFHERFHDQSEYFALQDIPKQLKSSKEREKEDIQNLKENIAIVLPLLLPSMNLPQYERSLGGCYYAWRVILQWIYKKDNGTGAFLYEVSKHYASEVIPLALTRLTGTSIALDLDIHIEIIRLFSYFFLPYSRKLNASQPSPRMYLPPVLRYLWKAVLTHIMRLLHVLMSLQTATENLHVRENKQVKMLGTFTNLPLYVDLHNMLLKQKQENVTTSLAPTKTELLTETCLGALSGIIRCAGKDCINFVDELLHTIGTFVDLYPKACVEAVVEIILSSSYENIPHQTSTSAMNGPLGRAASESALPKPQSPQQRTKKRLNRSIANIRNFRKCSIDRNIIQEASSHVSVVSKLLQSSNELEFTTPRKVSTLPRSSQSLTSPDVSDNSDTRLRKRDLLRRVVSRGNPSLQKKLEPLMNKILQVYLRSHNLKVQQTILCLVGAIEAEHMNLQQYDSESKIFINFVVNQVLGKRSYLKDPPRILPYIYDFISHLTISRTDQVSLESIKRLTTCVFTSPQWGASGRLIPAIHSMLFHLYATTVSSPEYAHRINELREYFFTNLLKKLPYITAIRALHLILTVIKNRNQELFLRYSQSIADSLFPLLAESTLELQPDDIETVQELFESLDQSVIHVSTIIQCIIDLWENKSLKDISWLSLVLVFLHILCGYIIPHREDIQNKLQTPEHPSMVTFLLQILVTATDAAVSYVVPLSLFTLQRLTQHIIYLLQHLQQPQETGNLVDVLPEVSLCDESDLRTLEQIVAFMLSLYHIPLHVLCFRLLRVLRITSKTLWQHINIHSISEAFSFTWRPEWYSYLIEIFSGLSYSNILFRSDDFFSSTIEESFQQEKFVSFILRHCLEVDIRNVLRILPLPQVKQLVTAVKTSFCVQSQQRSKTRVILLQEISCLFLLLRDDVDVNIELLEIIGVLVRAECFVLSYSTRKVFRRFVKTILSYLSDELNHFSFTEEQRDSLIRNTESLQSSVVFRRGSDQIAALKKFTTQLQGAIDTPDDIIESNEALTVPVDSLKDICIRGFQSGQFTSLSCLATVDVSLFCRMLREGSLSPQSVMEFVLDKKGGLESFATSSQSTSPGVDLIQFDSDDKTNEYDDITSAIISFFHQKLSSAHKSVQDRIEISLPMVALMNTNPTLVEQMIDSVGLSTIISFCMQAISSYISGEQFRYRQSQCDSISSVLLLLAFALISCSSTWSEDENLVQQVIEQLYRLFEVSRIQSEHLFDVQTPLHLSSLSWDQTRPSDILTTMIVQLLTPTLGQGVCTFVTPLDTRPSTLFEYTHGRDSLNAFIHLLSIITRHTIGYIYPEAIEDGNELFLETPIASLGMTASDMELLENATQLLPILFVQTQTQLQSIFDLFTKLLAATNAPEPLRVLSCKGLRMLMNQLKYIELYQTGSLQRIPVSESKANFFLTSPQGEKLVSIQRHIHEILLQHPSRIDSHVKHSGTIYSHGGSQYGSFARAEANVSWEDRYFSLCQKVNSSEFSLMFLFQKGFLHVSEETVRDLVNKAATLFIETANALQMPGKLIFLREHCLASLLGVCSLLCDEHVDALLELSSFIYEKESPGDHYGVQVSVIAYCQGVCELLQRKKIISANVMAVIPLRLRRCFESNHAMFHIAGLKALLYLIKAKQYEIVTGLLPCIFTFATNIWQENTLVSKIFEVQYLLMLVVFEILERYTKEVEQHNFAKIALESFARMVESPKTPPKIVAGIFRGFNGLLVSFSLSHAQRILVCSCALQHLPSSLFPHALGLMITTMYTGDKNEVSSPLHENEQNVQMDNIERIKMLFSKLHVGSIVEAEAVAKVIPRLLLDFFGQEQVMSLLLGEFVRTSQRQRPELIAQILFHVVSEYRENEAQWVVVLHWISLCLKNFIQMEPLSYSLWAMSCLFVCVSSSPSLRLLYRELANNSHHLNEDLFLFSAVEYYRNLDDKELFLAVFDTRNPLTHRLLSLCYRHNLKSLS